jgi:hypothetical protein
MNVISRGDFVAVDGEYGYGGMPLWSSMGAGWDQGELVDVLHGHELALVVTPAKNIALLLSPRGRLGWAKTKFIRRVP